ncbi:hypothetical protein ACW9HC_05450 [Nocardia gipuzkoensis]
MILIDLEMRLLRESAHRTVAERAHAIESPEKRQIDTRLGP